MKVLITGVAGFIGMHVAQRLLAQGFNVTGIDNLNDYYDPGLKRARLERLGSFSGFRFHGIDIEDEDAVSKVFESELPEKVVHLAAQAGVRHSLENPRLYIRTNVQGFLNILEGVRAHPVEHLVYASSSSVYGSNQKLPFCEHDAVDHPVSLYAATKRSNELMAHSYSHLFGIPTTGLRFFTAYGPWGRPDMSMFLFTRAILEGREIHLYNRGEMRRDFTYIGDIVEGVLRVLEKPPVAAPVPGTPHPSPALSDAPFRVLNIGNSSPVDLREYVAIIEEALGRPARVKLLDMQPGDVRAASCDTAELEGWVSFKPTTPLREGVREFVAWYRDYFRA